MHTRTMTSIDANKLHKSSTSCNRLVCIFTQEATVAQVIYAPHADNCCVAPSRVIFAPDCIAQAANWLHHKASGNCCTRNNCTSARVTATDTCRAREGRCNLVQGKVHPCLRLAHISWRAPCLEHPRETWGSAQCDVARGSRETAVRRSAAVARSFPPPRCTSCTKGRTHATAALASVGPRGRFI